MIKIGEKLNSPTPGFGIRDKIDSTGNILNIQDLSDKLLNIAKYPVNSVSKNLYDLNQLAARSLQKGINYVDDKMTQIHHNLEKMPDVYFEPWQ